MSRNAAQPGVAADELLAVARTSQLNASIVGLTRAFMTTTSCLGSYKIGDATKSGEVVKLIHGQSVDVLVFEDSNGRTNWETRMDPPSPCEVKAHNLYSRLHGRASRIKHEAQREEIDNELARALFRALHEREAPAALAHFSDVKDRIAQEATVRARVIYAATASCVAGITVAVAFLTLWYVVDVSIRALIVGTGVGAAGAWVSVVQRAWRLNIRPFDSAFYLAFQGATRVALGALFGGFAVVAIKAGLVLAPLASTTWGVAAFSFAGGASERLVPELLRVAESAALKDPRPDAQ